MGRSKQSVCEINVTEPNNWRRPISNNPTTCVLFSAWNVYTLYRSMQCYIRTHFFPKTKYKSQPFLLHQFLGKLDNMAIPVIAPTRVKCQTICINQHLIRQTAISLGKLGDQSHRQTCISKANINFTAVSYVPYLVSQNGLLAPPLPLQHPLATPLQQHCERYSGGPIGYFDNGLHSRDVTSPDMSVYLIPL